MKKLTVDDTMSFSPYYTRERVRELFGEHQTMTALDIIQAKNIPAEHRLWLVLREEVLPDAILHELACQVAESALVAERAAGREPDVRSWAAIDAKRAWLREEIGDEELKAAQSAAQSVAESAAESAAQSAAEFAAEFAARFAAISAAQSAVVFAAWFAAWSAAQSAAESAAWSAAWVKAREQQCELLAELVGLWGKDHAN